MKTLVGLFVVTAMTFVSVSASANEGILSRLNFVTCQERNASVAIDLDKKTVNRERFSADTHTIKNIRLDHAKNQIAFEEVTSHGDIEYALRVSGGVYGDGMVSVDLILGEAVLFECRGFVKR